MMKSWLAEQANSGTWIFSCLNRYDKQQQQQRNNNELFHPRDLLFLYYFQKLPCVSSDTAHSLYSSEISARPNFFNYNVKFQLSTRGVYAKRFIVLYCFTHFVVPCTRPNSLICILFSSPPLFGSWLRAGWMRWVKLWLLGEYITWFTAYKWKKKENQTGKRYAALSLKSSFLNALILKLRVKQKGIWVCSE